MQLIEQSGIRMLNILNDLISISKVESNLMELSLSDTNIPEHLHYIWMFFKPEVEKKGMYIHLNHGLAEDTLLYTDSEKLYAILTNLVKNAVKYSNEGFIELGCSLQNDSFEFYVKDTGIGIDQKQLTKT